MTYALTGLGCLIFIDTYCKPNKSLALCKQPNRITKGMSNIDLIVVISKVNMVGYNPKEWWIYTSATCHVCFDKKMFSIFEPVETGESVHRELCHFKNQGPRQSGLKDDIREEIDSN